MAVWHHLIAHRPSPIAHRPLPIAHRPLITLILDTLILLACIAALVIELSGGFFTAVGGLRVSARSADRALFVALGLLIVRYAIDRHAGFLGIAKERWRERWNRYFQSQADPRLYAGRARGRASPGARYRRTLSVRRGRAVPSAGGHGLGARSRRSALFDVADRLGEPSAPRGSPSAVRREHLLPRAADADLLGCDAPARAVRGAAPRPRHPSGHHLQPADVVGVPLFRGRDLCAGQPPDRIASGGFHCGCHLRLLSLPVRALQPSRAAVHAMDAALAAGDSSIRRDVAHAACGAGGACGGGPAVLVDVLRRVLPLLWRDGLPVCSRSDES